MPGNLVLPPITLLRKSSTSRIKNGNICCANGNVIANIIIPDTKPNVILLVAAETINDCIRIPTTARPLIIFVDRNPLNDVVLQSVGYKFANNSGLPDSVSVTAAITNAGK